jgi:hypothetical protein
MTPQSNNIGQQQKELVTLFKKKVKEGKLQPRQVSLLIGFLYDLARYVDNNFYREMKKRNLTKDHESVLALRFYDDKLQGTINEEIEKIRMLQDSSLPNDFFEKVVDCHSFAKELAEELAKGNNTQDEYLESNNYFNAFFPKVSSYVSNTMDTGKRFAKIYSSANR